MRYDRQYRELDNVLTGCFDSLTRMRLRLAWGKRHDDRFEAASLRRQRDELHETANRYLDRARSAEATVKTAQAYNVKLDGRIGNMSSYVSKLQSKIARQSAVIDGRDPVSEQRDYWKAEAQRLRETLRRERTLRNSTFGKLGQPEQLRAVFDVESHPSDVSAYIRQFVVYGSAMEGRTFSTTPEQMGKLREQMRDTFSVFDVEPVKPTLRDRLDDAIVDFQFWLADRLEDAAEWLRVR